MFPAMKSLRSVSFAGSTEDVHTLLMCIHGGKFAIESLLWSIHQLADKAFHIDDVDQLFPTAVLSDSVSDILMTSGYLFDVFSFNCVYSPLRICSEECVDLYRTYCYRCDRLDLTSERQLPRRFTWLLQQIVTFLKSDQGLQLSKQEMYLFRALLKSLLFKIKNSMSLFPSELDCDMDWESPDNAFPLMIMSKLSQTLLEAAVVMWPCSPVVIKRTFACLRQLITGQSASSFITALTPPASFQEECPQTWAIKALVSAFQEIGPNGRTTILESVLCGLESKVEAPSLTDVKESQPSKRQKLETSDEVVSVKTQAHRFGASLAVYKVFSLMIVHLPKSCSPDISALKSNRDAHLESLAYPALKPWFLFLLDTFQLLLNDFASLLSSSGKNLHFYLRFVTLLQLGTAIGSEQSIIDFVIEQVKKGLNPGNSSHSIVELLEELVCFLLKTSTSSSSSTDQQQSSDMTDVSSSSSTSSSSSSYSRTSVLDSPDPELLLTYRQLIETRYLPTIDASDGGKVVSKASLANANEAICTYFYTGDNFATQGSYQCYTCNLVEDKGCCSACARICHKDHDITYHDTLQFFCDCGLAFATEKKMCKCLPSFRLGKNDLFHYRPSATGSFSELTRVLSANMSSIVTPLIELFKALSRPQPSSPTIVTALAVFDTIQAIRCAVVPAETFDFLGTGATGRRNSKKDSTDRLENANNITLPSESFLVFIFLVFISSFFPFPISSCRSPSF
jgi:hypothetical protein